MAGNLIQPFGVDTMKQAQKQAQRCAQFDSKNECNNPAQVNYGWTLDFCAKHNHMVKDGIPLKCWKCGDN
jgi:hypothetical protein